MPKKSSNRARREGQSLEDAEIRRALGVAPPEPASVPVSSDGEKKEDEEVPSFKDLGVCEPLCDACESMGWSKPTAIQVEALPWALKGRDVIGLAQTGSGKTGAFAIPVLQGLLANPRKLSAVVLAPTRELAFQIADQFKSLGAGIDLRTSTLVGGVDMMSQAISLARGPHVVVATPGRLVDHLENTKGFSLGGARYLILDEADRMLSLDFEEAIHKVVSTMPKERQTLLFSATMTSKVAKLQRASLQDPVRVEVSSRFSTVDELEQQFLLVPHRRKDAYLSLLLSDFVGKTAMVFVSTCANAQRVALTLRVLGFSVVCLHGQMSQSRRLAALHAFRAGEHQILIATDVAARGLDIPSVDVVINYDVPANGKDYVHRVGRTARAGRTGRAITLVSQYDVELYQRVEHLIGQKLEPYPADKGAAAALEERVSEAAREASRQLRELAAQADSTTKGRKRARAFISEAGAQDEGDALAQAALASSSRKRQHLSNALKTKRRKK